MSRSNRSTTQEQRAHRRVRGLNRSFSDLREEHKTLQEEVDALREENRAIRTQLKKVQRLLEDHMDQNRAIRVHENRLDDLELRLHGKVGRSTFEMVEETLKQLRARIEFLADYLDAEAQKELTEQA